MSLITDLVDRILGPIWDRIKKALGPLGKLFDLVSHFFTSFKDAFNTGQELAAEIINEINEWRNFREAVPVRTGVINLPSAIDKTQELLDQIRAAWAAIVDLAKNLKSKFQGTAEDPTADAEEALSDIENSSFRNILEKFPKLAKGLEKLLGFLAIAVDALESIKDAINDVKAIVDAIKGIREEIETGGTIFLQQKNSRRLVRLEDGTEMKIRVGNLHS